MTKIAGRKGMPDVQIDRHEFVRRFRNRFFDPAFDGHEAAIAAIVDTAWDGYHVYGKNPRKARAGADFANPEAMLPVECLDTRKRIREAEARQKNPASPNRVLLVNGSMRRASKTCAAFSPTGSPTSA